jgi:hypothetical protein
MTIAVVTNGSPPGYSKLEVRSLPQPLPGRNGANIPPMSRSSLDEPLTDKEKIMKRSTILLAMLMLCLCPLIANAAEPSYGMKFVETRKKTVEVAFVDLEGLGRQMGFQKSDTIVSIDSPSLDGSKTIRTNEDIVEALKKLRGKYEIKITRPLDEKGSKTEEKTLKGVIRESKNGKEFYLLKD